ncbi:MAG TPA: EAL domain-containing protein [Nocardioides sp.]|nr:EAL domain-containing protein [Nocardioides sp.]
MSLSSWRPGEGTGSTAEPVVGPPHVGAAQPETVDALAQARRRIRALEGELADLVARHESLMRHASDVTVVTDATTTVHYASPGVSRLLGHVPSLCVGRSLLSLVDAGDRDVVLRAARAVVAGGTSGEVRARFRHARGHTRHVAVALKDARADPAVRGLVWNLRDVSEEALLAERLRHQAYHDHLTGLANRAMFLEALEVELAGLDESRPVAVCLVDLDKLKEANDRYGHQAGDALLQVAAQRFRAAIRPGDLVARLGGDEFGVLLRDVDLAGARAAAQRLIAGLEQPVTVGDVRLEVSASFGLTMVTEPGTSVDRCIEEADVAMYRAKAARDRDLVLFDPSMVRDDPRRRAGEIADLLEDPAGLATVYQPMCTLDGARVLGYEALTRFPGREYRTVEEWFRLGRLAQRSAALEAAALRRALRGPRPGGDRFLSVNVSPEALGAPEVQEALEGDLSGVVIEITEHNELDGSQLLHALTPLRERGARIAVDDTGAGYANLQQLVRLRPDLVKLDRELVQEVHRHPEKRALVEALVSFCRRTGATLCAEGIEVVEELVTLADLGVGLGQGWLIGRPGPAFGEASAEARAVSGGLTLGASTDDLSPVLARVAASRLLFDLGGAVRALSRLFPIDDIAVSVIEDDCMKVFTQHDWTALGAQYRLEDYPASKHALDSGELVSCRVDDPGADPAEVRLLREIGFGSLLLVPVREDDGRPVALMELYARDARQWTEAELAASVATAGAVRAALRRMRDAGEHPA